MLNKFPIKPLIVPDITIISSEFFNNSSKSQYGSFKLVLFMYDLDESSIILLYPVSFFAIKVNNPISSKYLNLICVPINGFVPCLEIFSENSNAPLKLYVSDKPML